MDESYEKHERRTLLKGAAAVGIGAAAWAVPDITSMGGTPAYAASCTAGSTIYGVCRTNTSCSCVADADFVSNGVPYLAGQSTIDYKPCNGRCDNALTFPGTASILASNSGSCGLGSSPNGNGGGQNTSTAAVSAAPTDPNLFCKVVVRVYDGSACVSTFTEFSGNVPNTPGPSTLDIPQVPCAAGAGGGNKFVAVFVECSTERECLF